MSLPIGDTPAQLGKIQAADAMMIDGKIVTRDDYRALVAQVEALCQVLGMVEVHTDDEKSVWLTVTAEGCALSVPVGTTRNNAGKAALQFKKKIQRASRLSEIEKSDSQAALALTVDSQALVVQLENLRIAAENLMVQKQPEKRRRAFAILSSRLKSTPRQCLNELKVQAVNSFANWACGDCKNSSEVWLDMKANQYVEKIRKGGAE